MHAQRLVEWRDEGGYETGETEVEAQDGGDIVYVGRASFRMAVVEGGAVPVTPMPEVRTEPHTGTAAPTADSFAVSMLAATYRTEDDLPVSGELDDVDLRAMGLKRGWWSTRRATMAASMSIAIGLGIGLSAAWHAGKRAADGTSVAVTLPSPSGEPATSASASAEQDVPAIGVPSVEVAPSLAGQTATSLTPGAVEVPSPATVKPVAGPINAEAPAPVAVETQPAAPEPTQAPEAAAAPASQTSAVRPAVASAPSIPSSEATLALHGATTSKVLGRGPGAALASKRPSLPARASRPKAATGSASSATSSESNASTKNWVDPWAE